jgi:hypothetical protein
MCLIARPARALVCGLLMTLGMASVAGAVELKKETVAAYERYLRGREAEAQARLRPGRNFLWTDDSPERKKKVRASEIVVEPVGDEGQIPVPEGLIHDWIGAIFLPGVTIQKVLAAVHDFNNYKTYFKPTVVASRLLTHNDDEHTFYLRLKKKAIVTAVVDGEFLNRYAMLDQGRSYGRERSARLVEVEEAGTADEHPLLPGTGHGFLWRLDAFTRFQERDGGVYVEVEALALSRDIPSYVAWFVDSIVRRLSRGSLVTSLHDIRAAVVGK